MIENASDTMDLGWNDSPSATAIQAEVETNGQQGKGTTYTVYTVVGKCYRLSAEASCLSASKQGLVTSSGAVGAYKYVGEGNKAVDAASITDATKFPTARSTLVPLLVRPIRRCPAWLCLSLGRTASIKARLAGTALPRFSMAAMTTP